MSNIVYERANPHDQGNFILFEDGTTACEVEGTIISTFQPTPASIQFAKSFLPESQNARDLYTAAAMEHAKSFLNNNSGAVSRLTDDE